MLSNQGPQRCFMAGQVTLEKPCSPFVLNRNGNRHKKQPPPLPLAVSAPLVCVQGFDSVAQYFRRFRRHHVTRSGQHTEEVLGCLFLDGLYSDVALGDDQGMEVNNNRK